MNHSKVDDWATDNVPIDSDELPETVPDGSALCIAKPAPLTELALPIRITNRYANSTDCRIIVTSSVSAKETIRQQKSIVQSGAPRLGVVDTSADERLDALYQENPTIFLPRSGDLAQISIALEELEESLSSSCPKTHVILRSLTPILAESSLDGVSSILKHVIECQRSNSSLTVFSVEYTEHGEATMTALKKNHEKDIDKRGTRTRTDLVVDSPVDVAASSSDNSEKNPLESEGVALCLTQIRWLDSQPSSQQV